MKKQFQKGFILPIIIAVIAIAVLATGGYFAYKQYSAPKPVVCTQEAKLCPDGSYVSRIAPDCEFAACPTVVDQTAGWQTYRNDKYGFEFKYPGDWKLSPKFSDNPVIGIYTGGAGEQQGGSFDVYVLDALNVQSVTLPLINFIEKEPRRSFIMADMSSMVKNIIQEKTGINVGVYVGSELIANFCYANCSTTIGPISIIDIPVKGKIYHIEYTEGILNSTKDWKYYDDFKEILSTFKFIR